MGTAAMNTLRLSLVAALSISGSTGHADRSELGYGFDVSSMTSLSHSTLRGTQESYQTLEDESSKFRVAFTPKIIAARLGLGLSLTTTAWLSIAYEESTFNAAPLEGSYLCQDPIREEELNSGGTLNSGDHCLKQNLSVDQTRMALSIGASYKPLDDLSPVFEAMLGFTYKTPDYAWLTLERSENIEANEQSWRPLDIGDRVHLPSVLSPTGLLSLGLEKRLFSRWGLRTSIWFRVISEEMREFMISSGGGITLIYFHYIRLL